MVSAWRSCRTIARRTTSRAGHLFECWKIGARRSPASFSTTRVGGSSPPRFRLLSTHFGCNVVRLSHILDTLECAVLLAGVRAARRIKQDCQDRECLIPALLPVEVLK